MSNQSQRIVPGLIKEEVITRRVDGETISYIVSLGPEGKTKTMDLSKIDGEVFGSLEEVRQKTEQDLEILIEKYRAQAVELCNEAEKLATSWYGEQVAQQSTANKLFDPSTVLDNTQPPRIQDKEALKQELIKKWSVMPEDPSEGGEVMVEINGKIVPVKMTGPATQ